MRRRAINPEHLIETVRHEDHSIRTPVMEQPPVIMIHRVTVPITLHIIHCHEGKEPVHVQGLFQAGKTLVWVPFADGRYQCAQTRMVRWVIPGINGQAAVDILAETAVVKVA